MDESAVIRAKGLEPNEHVSIQAELTDGGSEPWSSQAEFVADPQGTIDSSQQAPVKGSYDEVSAMGLVWSMKPQTKPMKAYQAPKDLGTQIITFRLLRNGQPAASVQLEQLGVAEGVQQIKLEGQLHGVLLLPNTKERRPGVLVVGGSEGGLSTRKAAWLASRGYAALALAYFHYEGLPERLENIPLEYFGSAIAWMMQRPEIIPGRIAVMGTSRGGELALQLGSMYPQIKAVVAYVPADVRYPSCCGNTSVPYAWTWQGQPLAYDTPWMFRRDAMQAMRAAIAVENTRGPILLISGENDGEWESTRMADAVVSRLKRSHFSFSYQHLKYPHAGHRAGRPEIVPAWHWGGVKPPLGGKSGMGGSAEGDAHSSLDAIPKVLEFLRAGLAG
jgi:dienelactone hydrolase